MKLLKNILVIFIFMNLSLGAQEEVTFSKAQAKFFSNQIDRDPLLKALDARSVFTYVPVKQEDDPSGTITLTRAGDQGRSTIFFLKGISEDTFKLVFEYSMFSEDQHLANGISIILGATPEMYANFSQQNHDFVPNDDSLGILKDKPEIIAIRFETYPKKRIYITQGDSPLGELSHSERYIRSNGDWQKIELTLTNHHLALRIPLRDDFDELSIAGSGGITAQNKIDKLKNNADFLNRKEEGNGTSDRINLLLQTPLNDEQYRSVKSKPIAIAATTGKAGSATQRIRSIYWTGERRGY